MRFGNFCKMVFFCKASVMEPVIFGLFRGKVCSVEGIIEGFVIFQRGRGELMDFYWSIFSHFLPNIWV